MSVQKANKDLIRIEIAELINKVKEQSDRIGNQKDIPQEELDLILHRIEDLHRKMVVWQYLNELPESVPLQEAPAMVDVKTTTSANADAESQEVSITAGPNEEALSDRALRLRSVPAPPRVDKKESGTESLEPTTTGNEERGSVNRNPGTLSRAESRDENLKDLQSFIGFNEKLMYIRQVFRGNNVAYDEALNVINSMRSMGEVQPFLTYLAEEFKWSNDSEPVVIFKETVKRRFS